RLQGDWSSDVCSSDLHAVLAFAEDGGRAEEAARGLLAVPVDHAEAEEADLLLDRHEQASVGIAAVVADAAVSAGGSRGASPSLRSEERRVGKGWRAGW